MRAIHRFVAANRSLCGKLEERFPRFFRSDLSTTTYLPGLRSRVQPYTEAEDSRLLEVGGVDRPLIENEEGFHYAGLDIDERPTCYEVYDEFILQSVEQPIEGSFDVVFSTTVLEHVPDNRSAVRSIFGALTPGGQTFHYVPNKGHPYALVLRVVGNRAQRTILRLISAGKPVFGGYPTYFDHCTVKGMKQLFEEAGFEDVELTVYYSPTTYALTLVPAYVAMACMMQTCRALGLDYFASGFIVSARRPAEGAASG